VVVRVGRARRLATGVPEEWSSPPSRAEQNPAYRPSGVFPFRSAACPKFRQFRGGDLIWNIERTKACPPLRPRLGRHGQPDFVTRTRAKPSPAKAFSWC